MATTSPISKTYHARSISLPSRPHPLISRCIELLCRFSASEAVSSSTMSSRLIMLKDLHDCVDDLLQLPENRHMLSHESHEKCVNGLLDGSLRLLDVCGSAKDALSQNRECAHEIQSSLRRRSSGEIAKESALYLAQRRKIKKASGHQYNGTENLNTDHDDLFIGSILRQTQTVTAAVLESLVAFIAGQKVKAASDGKWSLVAKMLQSKGVSSRKHDKNGNEFEMVDAALKSLMDHKTDKAMQVDNVQILLQELESVTEDLEQAVECLFRQLIKARVSLLNIINH